MRKIVAVVAAVCLAAVAGPSVAQTSRGAAPPAVLTASEWGFERSVATDGPVYTDPGEIPRLQVAGQGEGEAPRPLPLEHTHVRARLTGFIAEVEVRQTYGNPFSEPIEAVYIFPLPENSAVNHMRMEIGERVIEAQIHRREAARQIYEHARREGYTAALLEQERPNIFTQSVANIAPGENIDVVVRYVQDLTYDAGVYEFVFPMVVGPRFVPGHDLPGPAAGAGTTADTDEVPDGSRISPPYIGRGERSGHDISLEVVADSSLAIGDFHVPTHQVTVTRPSEGLLQVALDDRDSIPNRDFILRYNVAGDEPRATLFLSGGQGEGGFFSLAVHPPSLDIEQLVGQRELIFVVDVSGSMSGVPMAMCQAAMRDALQRIRPVDTFNIITFAGRTGQAFEAPRPANDTNLRLANQFVGGMRAGGGTYMDNAIDAALSTEVEGGRHRYVFFMTDGHVGNEDMIFSRTVAFVRALEARQQRARVFGYGVGSSVNRHLLEGLSSAGRGIAVYATNREDPARGVNQFFRYIDRSVIQDVVVDWADLGEEGVLPEVLPDLFASHAIVLHGRYARPPTGPMHVRGRAGDRAVSLPVAVRLTEVEGDANEVLGTLWARSRVADLEEDRRRGVDVTEEITRLGLEHHLVTRFTSFVAVDLSRRVGQGDPEQVVQPVEVPEGMDGTMAGAVSMPSDDYASEEAGDYGEAEPCGAPARYRHGCHCRTTGAGAAGDALPWLVTLTVLALLRRRRR